MFTRISDDACSVNNRDGRNEDQYNWTLSQLPNFRREGLADIQMQIYRNQGRGIDQDISIENHLFNIGPLNNSCNGYEAGIQQATVDAAPQYQLRCLSGDLKPTYTKLGRVANNVFQYENPNRAQPGWYWFVSPPVAVQNPGIGLYAADRIGYDTQQAAKDAARAPTRRGQYFTHSKGPNRHFVPLLKGECSHFGLFQ
jgi:hypothetical protein